MTSLLSVYVRLGGGWFEVCEYTAECVYVRWGGGGLRCAPCVVMLQSF